MKYYFVLNPAAGQGGAAELKRRIYNTARSKGIDFGIYTSKAPGDALVFAKMVSAAPGDKAIFACGGDGTLSEVVNGVMEHRAEAERLGKAPEGSIRVGCVPCGTGNDFVRNFPDAGDFTDIAAQIDGSVKKCDLIYYETERYDFEGAEDVEDLDEPRKQTGYSINMFNIGFDANVVDMTQSMKKKPFMAGSIAYLASVAVMLLRKRGADLWVAFEDNDVYSGKMLLIAVTNGCYCGGGVKGIPNAQVDDGLMDISLIKNASRRQFIKFFPKYMKGTHLEDKVASKLVIYKKSKSLTIVPNRKTMRLCIDGEMITAGRTVFRICEQAVDFVLPNA